MPRVMTLALRRGAPSTPARRLAKVLRVTPIAVGSGDSGEHLPAPPSGDSTAARAIGNQHPFVLGHGSANL